MVSCVRRTSVYYFREVAALYMFKVNAAAAALPVLFKRQFVSEPITSTLNIEEEEVKKLAAVAFVAVADIVFLRGSGKDLVKGSLRTCKLKVEFFFSLRGYIS